MHYHFLQDLQQVTFEGVPETGAPLGDDIVLLTTPGDPARLLDGLLAPAVSQMHADASKRCPTHLMVLNKYRHPCAWKGEVDAITYTVMDHSFLFLEALWLVRDNCGSLGAGYAVGVDDDAHTRRLWIPHTNLNFTARATREDTAFTRADLDLAIRYFGQLLKVMPTEVRPEGEPRPLVLVHASRLGRALYLTQGARSQADIGLKIAFICMALEGLFATVNDGVSRQVSERVAAFLEGTGAGFRTIFKDVRLLYKFRSIVVHGDQLNVSREARLRNIAVAADDYLRRCIVKMLDSPELLELFSKNDRVALDAHFKELMPRDGGARSASGCFKAAGG